MMLSCMKEAKYIVDVDVHGADDGNSAWFMLMENARTFRNFCFTLEFKYYKLQK